MWTEKPDLQSGPTEPEHSQSRLCKGGEPMLGLLRSIGLTPDMFYAASIGSMFLSLLLWVVPRGGRKDSGRPERLAVFVGLWPPTLFLMGHALREDEKPV
jgi:hypothetical protein